MPNKPLPELPCALVSAPSESGAVGDEVHVINGNMRLSVMLDLQGHAHVMLSGSGVIKRVERIDGKVVIVEDAAALPVC